MMEIEKIEQLYQLAHSKDVYDYIQSLHIKCSCDKEYWVPTSFKGLLILFNTAADEEFVLYPDKKPDNSIDWIFLNGEMVIIFPQHLLSRFRKRVLNKFSNPTKKFDIRGNVIDNLLLLFHLINSIQLHIVDGVGMLGKYEDSMFAWCNYGLMPVEQLSDLVYRCTTFIPTYMLKGGQLKNWKSVYNTLLENNALGK